MTLSYRKKRSRVSYQQVVYSEPNKNMFIITEYDLLYKENTDIFVAEDFVNRNHLL